MPEQSEVFAAIYARGEWGGGPGPGSTLEYTRSYRAFLEQFVVEHAIRSVLDLGCGDWSFTHAIDWKGARYVGVDIVRSVIERNRARHPGVEFVCGDSRSLDDFRGFDLLVVKDVLQHWSNLAIASFLAHPALATFRHVLFVNCGNGDQGNTDIVDGGWRPLDLLAPPFSLRDAREVHAFKTKRVVHRGPRITGADIRERFEWWCINLDRRPDRFTHACAQLRRVGISRLHRLQAFDGPRLRLKHDHHAGWIRRGAIGCYLSHLAVLKQAQARRVPCVVIEDDLVLADDFVDAFDAFVAEVPGDWDVLHLPGGEHRVPPLVLGPHHARLVSTWGTSMSVLRLPAIDRLLELADDLERPIDDFYMQMMPSMRFFTPARKLVHQDWNLGTNIGDAG